MTEFQNKSFSVYPGAVGTQQYRDNYDRIFGKKKDEPVDEPVPDTERDCSLCDCYLIEPRICASGCINEEYGLCDCPSPSDP